MKISATILSLLQLFSFNEISLFPQPRTREMTHVESASSGVPIFLSAGVASGRIPVLLTLFKNSNSSDVDLDQIILEEAAAINQITGVNTKIILSDSDSSSSHPVRGIEISRKQMQRVRARSSVKRFREMVRFFIAHEKAHQFQYNWYSFAAVNEADAERHRLYECQADILAGKYLMEMIGRPTESDLQSIHEALQVVFDIGSPEFSNLEHPSHEQRRNAVRLGMASGMITSLSQLPPDPINQSMIRSLAEKVDILPGETVMTWSYRLAKKITNYSRAASVDLTLVDEQKIDWDTRTANPYVTYSLIYKNIGRKTLMIDMEVQCASVPRNDSNNTKYWLKWSVKNHRFKLLPGERYTASGKLEWYADPNLMPRLVFPPRPTSLMSCEYSR